MIEVMTDDAHSPNGHRCPTCGAEHRWPIYVFAHWRDCITHTCDCGNIVFIRYGRVEGEEH